MANPRGRRLIRWAAAVAVVVLLLLVWLSTRESPALRLSESIRPGMTRSEVEAILGQAAITLDSGSQTALLYGRSPIPLFLRAIAQNWLGLKDFNGDFHTDDWPVQVWFDANFGQVQRVERRLDGQELIDHQE